jgi:hypothetical protein
MYDDMQGNRPYHWHLDRDNWSGGSDTDLPKNSAKPPEPPRAPSRWKAAAKEVLTCVGIATAIGLPAYGIADWWYHKDIGKPTHGGQVRMTEQNHVELVVKPDRMVVYVTDHEGRPRDLKNTTITAGIGNGGVAQSLVPTGENTMELRGAFKLNKDTMVMVKVDKNCEQPEMAVFTPMSPEPPLPVGLICTTPKPRPATCRQ